MMYVKEINGRLTFSDCRTILTNDGVWISNPTEELIAAEGWVEYVPPIIPSEPMTEPGMEDIMQAVKRMLASSTENLSDEEALLVAALYPTWTSKEGKQVNIGERYWYDGKLYKVVQAHTVLSDWTPDVSASLFTEVTIDEWPEWVQPIGAQDAYMTGDKVTFEGVHYVSKMDYNTYSPAVYPAGWEARP